VHHSFVFTTWTKRCRASGKCQIHRLWMRVFIKGDPLGVPPEEDGLAGSDRCLR
jgi:hypothetical protein